jgi:hypothetical protein
MEGREVEKFIDVAGKLGLLVFAVAVFSRLTTGKAPIEAQKAPNGILLKYDVERVF